MGGCTGRHGLSRLHVGRNARETPGPAVGRAWPHLARDRDRAGAAQSPENGRVLAAQSASQTCGPVRPPGQRAGCGASPRGLAPRPAHQRPLPRPGGVLGTSTNKREETHFPQSARDSPGPQDVKVSSDSGGVTAGRPARCPVRGSSRGHSGACAPCVFLGTSAGSSPGRRLRCPACDADCRFNHLT